MMALEITILNADLGKIHLIVSLMTLTPQKNTLVMMYGKQVGSYMTSTAQKVMTTHLPKGKIQVEYFHMLVLGTVVQSH